MNIDCHYHLEPRVQSLENLMLKMDQYGIDRVALIPCMCDPIPHPPEFQLKVLRFMLTHGSVRGIAKKLITRFTSQGDIILPGGPLRIYSDPDNSGVADLLKTHPDRFLGWVFVNPTGEKDPVKEYEKWGEQEGYIGIKAHPFWHRYPCSMLMPIAQIAAKEKQPLLIHTGFDTHGDFLPLIENLPELKLVLAHTGFPNYTDTWKLIKNHPNVYVDLSADAYVDDTITRAAVDFLGPGRCLFGTDGPYGMTDTDGFFHNGFIKQRVQRLFPDPGIRKMLMGDTFKKIIGSGMGREG